MGEEIEKKVQVPMFNDVNRACTRWLIARGVYSTELSFRQVVDGEIREALQRKKKPRLLKTDKIDQIVDELSSDG